MLFSISKNNIVRKKCVSGNTNVSTNQDAVMTSFDRVNQSDCIIRMIINMAHTIGKKNKSFWVWHIWYCFNATVELHAVGGIIFMKTCIFKYFNF